MRKNLTVKLKLDQYRINIMWVNNSDNLNFVDSKSATPIEERIKQWKKYTNFIEEIFSNMKAEHAKILKAVYLGTQEINNMCYSRSSLYILHKNAVEEFLKYFNI